MSESTPPENSTRSAKVTRIDGKSATFRWVVPAALIVLSASAVALILASVALLLGILPGL